MFVTALYIKSMLSGHSAAQEIQQFGKFTSGFIGPQILNFEKSFGLFMGQQSILPFCWGFYVRQAIKTAARDRLL